MLKGRSAGTQEEIEKAYNTCWKPLPYYGTRATDESSNVRNYFVATISILLTEACRGSGIKPNLT